MAKNKKAPAVETVTATSVASAPSAPATYVNHAHVQWSDGMVRLDLGEARAGAPAEPRVAVAMTAAQARALADILNQAADALLPAATGDPSTGA